MNQLSLFDAFEGAGTAPGSTDPLLPMKPENDPFLDSLLGSKNQSEPAAKESTGWIEKIFDEAPQAPAAVQMTKRKQETPPHFYRCRGCLNVFTTEGRLTAEIWSKIERAECVCGSERVEYLGQSTVDQRIKETRELCACDFRCTEARGPNCTCKCGGVNHGTGLMIKVTRDKGAVPKLESPSPIKWKRTRDEWIAAQKAAEERMQKKHGQNLIDSRANKWIDREAFLEIRADFHRIHEAEKANTHAGRMKKIAAVAP